MVATRSFGAEGRPDEWGFGKDIKIREVPHGTTSPACLLIAKIPLFQDFLNRNEGQLLPEQGPERGSSGAR